MTALTTRELIAALMRVDPDGNMIVCYSDPHNEGYPRIGDVDSRTNEHIELLTGRVGIPPFVCLFPVTEE